MLTRLSQLVFIAAMLLLVLVLAKSVFIPLAFAFLIAFLLYPFCKKLERKLPRILAISIVFIITSLSLTALFFTVVKLFQHVMTDISGLEDVFSNFKEELINRSSAITGLSKSAVDSIIQENLGAIIKGPVDFISESLFTSTNFLLSSMITGVFVFFMLLYRNVFKNFILSQINKNNRNEFKEIVKEIQKVSQHYLVGVLFGMLIVGILNSLGLWMIGVKNPLFWGFFGALLTIIPYAGTFVGGFFPFIFTILTTNTVWQPTMVVVLFFAVQFLDDYFIKPKVVGKQIDLNPFMAIIALLIGGVIWGIPAFILALPYLAISKIILEHFKETESLATLFSSEVYDKPKVFQKKFSSKKYSLSNLIKGDENKEG